jgi:hypothetical protein
VAIAPADPTLIQQAKNPARGPQFLQIVAKPEPTAARSKPNAKPEPKLTRVAFKVSRLMEFCSERELENQTGHSVYEWPLVVVKELIDSTRPSSSPRLAWRANRSQASWRLLTPTRAVHLIKLKPDGSGRADIQPNPVAIGRGAEGVPIVIAPPNDLLGLALCERVEDALSIHAATCLGAWASGRATRLSPLADAVPNYIDFVTIYAERDPDGFQFAYSLAGKLRERGVANTVSMFDKGGRP